MSWVQKLLNKILCQLLRNRRYYYLQYNYLFNQCHACPFSHALPVILLRTSVNQKAPEPPNPTFFKFYWVVPKNKSEFQTVCCSSCSERFLSLRHGPQDTTGGNFLLNVSCHFPGNFRTTWSMHNFDRQMKQKLFWPCLIW
jgi:hypothetical protein